jgi:hypothetical protein
MMSNDPHPGETTHFGVLLVYGVVIIWLFGRRHPAPARTYWRYLDDHAAAVEEKGVLVGRR